MVQITPVNAIDFLPVSAALYKQKVMQQHSMKNANTVGKQTPVLIVGGGITGLTAALFLLQHGIRPLLVERHAGTSIHPRSRGFDVRTMELFRELQLDEAIREAGKALAPAWGMYQGETLAQILQGIDPSKVKVNHAIQLPGLERLVELSPASGARCTQDLCEPVLLQAARERGADIRFNTNMISFAQNAGEIIALIKDNETGIEETIACSYMIAADGAGSPIRNTLQAATTGAGSLGHLLNVYFEVDLGTHVKNREFSICRIEQQHLHGLLAAINNSNRWVFHLHYDPLKGEQLGDYTQERLEKIVQRMLGMSEINIRIISVLPWQPTVSVVNEMQVERIFLAGDAAHQMTPYGGKGANTGVQDVHNLAWKLAMVLQHKAGEVLLKTYSTERQPVGKRAAELSGMLADDKGLLDINKFKKITAPTAGEDHASKMIYMVGLPDYEYTSAAIIKESLLPENRLLSGRPGTRVPHVWINENDVAVSTLDWAVHNFAIITDDAGAVWQQAAKQASQQLQIKISVHLITENTAACHQWKEITGMKKGEAILVRPDGFIAWRCELATNATERLTAVMKNILSM